MSSLLDLLATAVSLAVMTTGCQPEVLIARNESVGGSGGAPMAGTGGGGSDAGGVVEPTGGTDAGAPPVEAPRLLADSVADFSLTQGDHSWLYGYDTGTFESFTPMPKQSTITAYMPVSKDTWDCWVSDTAHWTQIFQFGAHPNGTISSQPSNSVLQRAVRRWVCTYDGRINIVGEIAKIDVTPGGSNGVDASVYVDGGLPLYTTTIDGEDGGGRSFRVPTPTTVHVGSFVDFVLDPHEGDDRHDLSRFTGVILRADP
jgi:hypothetical protein